MLLLELFGPALLLLKLSRFSLGRTELPLDNGVLFYFNNYHLRRIGKKMGELSKPPLAWLLHLLLSPGVFVFLFFFSFCNGGCELFGSCRLCIQGT